MFCTGRYIPDVLFSELSSTGMSSSGLTSMNPIESVNPKLCLKLFTIIIFFTSL